MALFKKKKDSRELKLPELPMSPAFPELPKEEEESSMSALPALPQLKPFIQSNKQFVLFISRKGNKYQCSSKELTDDIDAGEEIIRRFLQDYGEGRISLSSVYLKIPNDQLATEPEIAHLIKLKGLDVNAFD